MAAVSLTVDIGDTSVYSRSKTHNEIELCYLTVVTNESDTSSKEINFPNKYQQVSTLKSFFLVPYFNIS